MPLVTPKRKEPTEDQLTICAELNTTWDDYTSLKVVRDPGIYIGVMPNIGYHLDYASEYGPVSFVPGTNWRRPLAHWTTLDENVLLDKEARKMRDTIRNCFTCFPGYGLVDTPEQFVEYFADIVDESPYPVSVFMNWLPPIVHPHGGARWHKNGEYLGDGNPEGEYIGDAGTFPDGVWSFNVEIVVPAD